MTRNTGTADRAIRALAAVAAVVVALLAGPASAPGIVLWVVAAVLLLTAAVGSCPVYRVLHIDTTGRRSTRV